MQYKLVTPITDNTIIEFMGLQGGSNFSLLTALKKNKNRSCLPFTWSDTTSFFMINLFTWVKDNNRKPKQKASNQPYVNMGPFKKYFFTSCSHFSYQTEKRQKYYHLLYTVDVSLANNRKVITLGIILYQQQLGAQKYKAGVTGEHCGSKWSPQFELITQNEYKNACRRLFPFSWFAE